MRILYLEEDEKNFVIGQPERQGLDKNEILLSQGMVNTTLGLTSLDLETATTLAKWNGKVLDLNDLAAFDEQVKKQLQKFTQPEDGYYGTISKIAKDSYFVDALLVKSLHSHDLQHGNYRFSVKTNSEGNVVGMRITGVRRSSLLYKMGLKNGDIMHSANGTPITSMDDVAKVFNSFKKFNHTITIEVVRRRKARTLRYEIQ